MKTLKFEHQLADLIRSGEKTSTWRIFDDKHFSVNDVVVLIDKVEPDKPNTWVEIGTAVLDRVTEKRIRDIVPEDYDGHEKYTSVDEIITTFRKFYGPEVNPDTAVKIIHFTLHDTAVEPQAPGAAPPAAAGKGIEKEMKLYADGGSRGNPGPSASGYAILNMHDDIVVKNGVYLGVTTNNQAEYQALKLGMEHAQRLGVQELHVYMDSLLVVNQMLGIFKIKNRDLWPIHSAIKEMLPNFKNVSFAHVPRELNKIADGQVNECLDAHVRA